jgi:multisubunit Na+/H+ antiporter MnhB subunit
VAGPGLAFSSLVLLFSGVVLVMGVFGIYLSKASFKKTVGWVALLIFLSAVCRLR